MIVGKFEFGWMYPRKWRKYRKDTPDCQCVIYEFGFWYFTILHKECYEVGE